MYEALNPDLSRVRPAEELEAAEVTPTTVPSLGSEQDDQRAPWSGPRLDHVVSAIRFVKERS